MIKKKFFLEIAVFLFRIFNLKERLIISLENYVISRHPRISIGKFTYGYRLKTFLIFGEKGNIKIGKYCSLAQGVKIFVASEHNYKRVTSFPISFLDNSDGNNDVFTKGPVEIGNDVWVGEGAYILSGVTIGDGAVIGAGAIVTKNIPPYAIAVGNPAKVVKMRFPQEIIEKLLEIRWWNWPHEKVIKNVHYFYDINNFIDEFTNSGDQQ